MIDDLIRRAMDANKAFRGGQLGPTGKLDADLSRIPTLKPNVYREMTDQLRKRFELLGRWEQATHGVWLSLDDMEELWQSKHSDPVIEQIVAIAGFGSDDWPNEASNMFKLERLSVFAASDLNYHKIYLLWLDEVSEPELWVYDSNGESRYPDLRSYLQAYVDGDLSASSRSWRA